MTYAALERTISNSVGYEVRIIDLGASESLSVFSRTGNCCVAQAIAFAALPHLTTNAKNAAKVYADPGKFQNLFSEVGVPIGQILAKTK